MRFDDLVEAVAGQEAELDRLAREGVATVPSPEMIAFIVRFQRALRGWTKQMLALFANVSVSTVERIERADVVSYASLDQLAVALEYESGAFTAPRVPKRKGDSITLLNEQAAYYQDKVEVEVRPLRTPFKTTLAERAGK